MGEELTKWYRQKSKLNKWIFHQNISSGHKCLRWNLKLVSWSKTEPITIFVSYFIFCSVCEWMCQGFKEWFMLRDERIMQAETHPQSIQRVLTDREPLNSHQANRDMGLSVHTPPAWASCRPARSCQTWGGSTNPACAQRLSSSPAALWHPARTGCARQRSCPAWTLSPGNDRDGFLAVCSLEANISSETVTVIPEAAQQKLESGLTVWGLWHTFLRSVA